MLDREPSNIPAQGIESVVNRLVILQPTNFCNIDCQYCYLPDRNSYNLMQPQTVDKIAEALFTSPFVSEKLRIVWHAGEPLTAPVSFYEDAVERFNGFNTNGIPISWGVQTNGTLINQDWCDFFKESDFDVGVSIDGPEEFHDRNRIDRRGRGTYKRVIEGVELLRKNGINWGILMVIDKYSAGIPELLWQFFVENGITSVGFNPEEISGVHHQSSLSYEGAGEDIENFYRMLANLNSESGNQVNIREVDDMVSKIKDAKLPVHNGLVTPFEILSFDYLGNVSTFSPQLLGQKHPEYGDFRFGNVHINRIKDMGQSPKFQKVYLDVLNGIDSCRKSCPYFDVCAGGDPSAKLAEHDTFNVTETLECRLRTQASFNVVIRTLEDELHI